MTKLTGDNPPSAAMDDTPITVGGVTCTVRQTHEPWNLDIDAIVVSVGTTLGALADAIRRRFPNADWDALATADIHPHQPIIIDLHRGAANGDGLRWIVCATTHEGGTQHKVERAPTLDSITTATVAALDAAAETGARAVGIPLLGTGALRFDPQQVAASVVPATLDSLAELAGSSLRELVFFGDTEQCVDAIRETLAKDGGNRAVATYSVTELAGGVSTDLVDPNKPIPLSRDHLGVATYVSMLATVMASRDTPLPLSVGVFGEWGAGKSYFMAMLRDQVGRLASSGNPAYCDEIVQIGFNAWHYADTDLWASLGDEIFRQLAGPGPSAQQQRERLRTELGERLVQRTELAAATQQAEHTAADLQRSVDEAVSHRYATARDLITALRHSAHTREQLNAIWSRLGIDDEVEQGELLAEQLHGTLTEAQLLHRSASDRRGKVALAATTVLMALSATAALAAPALWGWLGGLSAGFATAAVLSLVVLGRARSGIHKLRMFADDLRAGMDRAANQRIAPQIAELLAKLRQAEAEQRVAEAQLDEVVSQVGELGRKLAELTPGNRLYTFLSDRATGTAYRRNLGLISTIRKDFEQLIELMADWRAHPELDDGTRTPIDRIVLYIDDLDRCSPDQVVNVLEAVHLLLAMDLFVVVVGVDPRWLLRSLCSHYDEIIDQGNTTDSAWQVTPEDYLEKIINIPFVLPAMSSGSLHQLLRSTLGNDRASARNAPGDTGPASPRHDADGQSDTAEPTATELADRAAIPVESGSEVDHQQRADGALPRPLTDAEITFLSALDSLVGTPREAKRLCNLYRMLRATRDLSDASRFLGEGGQHGEYQAVVVLLGLLTAHATLLSAVLDGPPSATEDVAGGLTHRAPDTRWDTFVDDLRPRQSGQGWSNRVIGAIPVAAVPEWTRLHRGLAEASATIALTDLIVFQTWAPRIRRFSYVLAPQ